MVYGGDLIDIQHIEGGANSLNVRVSNSELASPCLFFRELYAERLMHSSLQVSCASRNDMLDACDSRNLLLLMGH
ncbi:hypothetical protein AgCh_030456 [Apium graveolens]